MNVIHVEDIDHSGDMLVAYFPQEKILVEADLYSPAGPGAAVTVPATPHELALQHLISTRGLAVDRIVPLHGRPVPAADLARLAGALP
jgi:hypothetical protein